MGCYHPMLGYPSITRSLTGKRPVVFSPTRGFQDLPIKIPCGKCVGCRLEKARQWAIRCMHEASLHEKNCFVTLTYNNENLPEDGCVSKEHLQKFMKRLRKRFYDKRIRFYACGEYGSKLSRPHYHLCLFGMDFPDKEILYHGHLKYFKEKFKKDRTDHTLYRSKILEELWPFGFSTIGDLTFESAGYTARYVMKKINGERSDEHYDGLVPEFALMSRGGKDGRGIGYEWIKKYKSDVYPKDFFTMNGKKLRAPKYYDSVLEGIDPRMYEKVKNERKRKESENQIEGCELLRRGQVKERKIKRHLQRSMENERGESV